MNSKFYILAVTSFSGLIIRTIYDFLRYKLRVIKENKFLDFLIIIVMFFTWGSWLNMPKNDPVLLNIPDFIRYAGLALYLAGVAVAVTGALQVIINIIRNFISKKNSIINYGIYAFIRHPMYYGFIMFIIGLPVYRKGLISFLTAPVWIFFLILWLCLEQKYLEEKLPGYRDYMKKTWF